MMTEDHTPSIHKTEETTTIKDTTREFQIEKGSKLGGGAFSEVFAAKLNGRPCAAKLLHGDDWNQLFKGETVTSESGLVQGEWQVLRALKDPYVIQYLGIVQDPETRLPTLLMERAVCSLTSLLHNHPTPGLLPQQTQLQLIHDITMGVAYLHSNGILHRDLSSNNILIKTELRAKVSDFGTAIVLGDKERSPGLRPWPGSMAYMPPEAAPLQIPNLQSTDYYRSEGPHSACYGYKLDVFSLGVLTVQISTRKYPKPTSSYRRVKGLQEKECKKKVLQKEEFERKGSVEKEGGFAEEGVWERVSEVVRRQRHIMVMGESHPLLPLARRCLSDRENYRPSAEQLSKDIANLTVK